MNPHVGAALDSLTVAQIAEDLNVGESTVRVWVNSNALRHYRLPGSKKQPVIRVRREAYEAFLAEYERSSDGVKVTKTGRFAGDK